MIEIEKKVLLNRVVFYIKGTRTLHREDGPAIIWNDGSTEWYYYGELHRKDGPALFDIEDSCEEWRMNGKLHREEGPAVIFGNGTVEWYLNDKLFSKEEWFEALAEEQKEKALYSKYFIGS
jgi:hypothetical protein